MHRNYGYGTRAEVWRTEVFELRSSEIGEWMRFALFPHIFVSKEKTTKKRFTQNTVIVTSITKVWEMIRRRGTKAARIEDFFFEMSGRNQKSIKVFASQAVKRTEKEHK